MVAQGLGEVHREDVPQQHQLQGLTEISKIEMKVEKLYSHSKKYFCWGDQSLANLSVSCLIRLCS